MPTLRTFAKRTRLALCRRWSDVYRQVSDLQLPQDPATGFDPTLRNRVKAEGIMFAGAGPSDLPWVEVVLNDSHFSNDPGNWRNSFGSQNYRGVPRALLEELLAVYTPLDAPETWMQGAIHCVAFLHSYGVTAAGVADGRGVYPVVLVGEADGGYGVACYDPNMHGRILDPNFSATPDEVHSGKYNGYREGPYDTRYGAVFM